MTLGAFQQSFTPLLIAGDKGPTLPVFTQLHIIFKQIRLSSEILEIVGIETLGFVMIVVEWAPLCFEIKDIEIKILILI
jgi:hypothetical protein